MPPARTAERHRVPARVVPPLLIERRVQRRAARRALAEVRPPHHAVLIAQEEVAHLRRRLHREVVDPRRRLDVQVRVRVEPLPHFGDVVLQAREVHRDDRQARDCAPPTGRAPR